MVPNHHSDKRINGHVPSLVTWIKMYQDFKVILADLIEVITSIIIISLQ